MNKIKNLNLDVIATFEDMEQEMFQLMRDRMGLGLAAPQLGNPVKMFVMSHSTLGNIAVYNPKILFQSEETTSLEEGCLTFPFIFLSLTCCKSFRR